MDAEVNTAGSGEGKKHFNFWGSQNWPCKDRHATLLRFFTKAQDFVSLFNFENPCPIFFSMLKCQKFNMSDTPPTNLPSPPRAPGRGLGAASSRRGGWGVSSKSRHGRGGWQRHGPHLRRGGATAGPAAAAPEQVGAGTICDHCCVWLHFL